MKLPGINYNQPVKSFGTIAKPADVSGGMLLADTINSLNNTATDYYKQESGRQATEAIQQARIQKDDGLLNLEAGEYDDDGTLVSRAWDDADGKFSRNDQEINDSVSGILKTDLAKRMYGSKMAELNVRYRSAYNTKVYGFQQENARATALNSVDKNMKAGDYSSAREDVLQARASNLINEAETLTGLEKVDYKERVDGLNQSAGNIGSAADMNSYRDMLANQTGLTDKDRRGLNATAEQAWMNEQLGEFSAALEAVETTNGPGDAYAQGMQAVLDADGTKAELMGWDELSKLDLMVKMRAIAAPYKVKADGNTAVAKRQNAMFSGADASENENNQMVNDLWRNGVLQQEMDGSTKYIPGTGMPFKDVLKPENRTQQEQLFGLAAQYHYIPNSAVNMMEPTFNRVTSGQSDPNETKQFVSFINELRQTDPVAFERIQGSKSMKDLAYRVGVYGTSPEGAKMAIEQMKVMASMSAADQAIWKKVATSPENIKYFEDNFDGLMKKKYDDTFWFWEASPKAKELYRGKVEKLSQDLLFSVKGKKEDAIRLAMEKLNHTFGVTNVNGAPEIIENPVERQNTFNAEGQAWDARAYLEESVKAAYPGMNTDNIRAEAVFPFDPDKPRYHVIHNDPDAGVFNVYLNDFTFDYRDSTEGKNAVAQQVALDEANRNLDRRNRAAEAYNVENKGTMAGAVNPHSWSKSQALTAYTKSHPITKVMELWGPGWEGVGKGAFEIKKLMIQPIDAAAAQAGQYVKDSLANAREIREQREVAQRLEEDRLLKSAAGTVRIEGTP